MKILVVLELSLELYLLFYFNRLINRSARGQRIVILILSVYIFLGYILRSFILLLLQPPPRFGDSVADGRIYEYTNYDRQLFSLHLIVITGLTGAIFGAYVFNRNFIPKKNNFANSPRPIMYFLLFITGITSLLLSGSGIRNPITITLSLVIIPSYLAILSYKLRNSSRTQFNFFLLLGFILAVLLAFYQSSKSPFFGFTIGYFLIREEQVKIDLRLSNLVKSLSVATLGLLIFIELQKVKSSSFSRISQSIGFNYFGKFHDFYLVIQRFDLIKSLTDAKFAENQEFLTPTTILGYIFNGLQWNWNSSQKSFGQLWAIHISAISDPGNLRTGTALSTGFISEGWLIGGYFGTALVSFIFIYLTCFISSNILRSELFFAFGITLISNNIFFERGLVGLSEGTALGSKVVVIFAIAGLVAKASGKGERNRAGLSSIAKSSDEIGE